MPAEATSRASILSATLPATGENTACTKAPATSTKPAVCGFSPLRVLEVQAHEEGDGQSGGVAYEGGQVGEGEYAIVAEQTEVEQRVSRSRLPQEKGRDPCPAAHQEDRPGQAGEHRETQQEGGEADSVEGRPQSVEASLLGPSPFHITQSPERYETVGHPERPDHQEEGSPSGVVDDDSSEHRAKSEA